MIQRNDKESWNKEIPLSVVSINRLLLRIKIDSKDKKGAWLEIAQ